MIRITQTSLTAPPDEIRALKSEFAATGCAMLPGFLAPAVLAPLLKQLEGTRFEERHESTDGTVFGTTNYVPRTEPPVLALNFFLNRPALFKLAAEVGGTPVLRNFLCRLHRTDAGTPQHIDWHDDAVENRTIGLNINLSADSFTGGHFELRDPERRIRVSVAEWKTGDAFLFRIGSGWQHRLTPVESGERTVGVGWFRTEPDWQIMTGAVLRSRILTETGLRV